MQFTFNERNFIETYLQSDILEDEESIINWLNENADYQSTQDITLEYIFMIPEVKDIEYLKEIKPPEIIEQILKESIFNQAEKNDPGLLLICIMK